MKRLLSFFAVVALLGAQNLQAQWIQTDGPSGGKINCFAVKGSNLFAGTDGGGVWRRPLAEMTTKVEEDFSQAPVGFTLEQNYPNPFWGGVALREISATTIRYQLPQTMQVVLKIYSISGQEVRTLINERQPAGVNSVVWDGRDQFGQ
ncbi:MAG: FlgD immunoglobulin-like domain containing protein [bacterium]